MFKNYSSCLSTSWAAKKSCCNGANAWWLTASTALHYKLTSINYKIIGSGTYYLSRLDVFKTLVCHHNSGFILPNITANKKSEKVLEQMYREDMLCGVFNIQMVQTSEPQFNNLNMSFTVSGRITEKTYCYSECMLWISA